MTGKTGLSSHHFAPFSGGYSSYCPAKPNNEVIIGELSCCNVSGYCNAQKQDVLNRIVFYGLPAQKYIDQTMWMVRAGAAAQFLVPGGFLLNILGGGVTYSLSREAVKAVFWKDPLQIIDAINKAAAKVINSMERSTHPTKQEIEEQMKELPSPSDQGEQNQQTEHATEKELKALFTLSNWNFETIEFEQRRQLISKLAHAALYGRVDIAFSSLYVIQAIMYDCSKMAPGQETDLTNIFKQIYSRPNCPQSLKMESSTALKLLGHPVQDTETVAFFKPILKLINPASYLQNALVATQLGITLANNTEALKKCGTCCCNRVITPVTSHCTIQ